MHKKSKIFSNGASDVIRGDKPYRDYTGAQNNDKKIGGPGRPSSKVFQKNNIISSSSKNNLNSFDKNYGKDLNDDMDMFYKDHDSRRGDSQFKSSHIGQQIMSQGKQSFSGQQSKVIRTQKHVSNKVKLALSDDSGEEESKYEFHQNPKSSLIRNENDSMFQDIEITRLRKELEKANKKIEVQEEELESKEMKIITLMAKYSGSLKTIKALEEELSSKEEQTDEQIEQEAERNQEMRSREREMMMQFVMNNMVMVRQTSAQDEEERMLQQVMEESRRTAGVEEQPNPDDMSYEALLALDENNVSKGLTQPQIAAIPEKVWRKISDTTKKEDSCSICFDKFERLQKVKELKQCQHAYHSKCIDKWLQSEKRCPICNTGVN